MKYYGSERVIVTFQLYALIHAINMTIVFRRGPFSLSLSDTTVPEFSSHHMAHDIANFLFVIPIIE